MSKGYTIGFLLLLLSACAPLSMQPAPSSGSGSSSQAVSSKAAVIPETISGALLIGSEDAPVTMLLFTNHNCAYCRDFEENMLPRLFYDFTGQGKLKIVIAPVPLQKYPDSDRNARTLICGVRSGSGGLIHRMLFEGQRNFPALKACLEDDPYLQSVMSKQHEIIRDLDVTLVPTYFINGKRFTGLPEYADLRGQIEEAIQR